MTRSNEADPAWRLAVDTTGMYTAQAGVARYIRGLLRGLSELGTSSPEVHPIAWEVENFGYRQPQRAMKTAYRELVWAPWIGPSQVRSSGAEVFLSTSSAFVTPPQGIGNVVVIHDVVALRFPEKFRRWARLTGPARLRQAARADRIVCISRFTAEEVMSLLEVPASKIDVVWNGCEFHPSLPIPEEEPLDPPPPTDFFLFVGSLEPAKNLELLRRAYLLAQSQGVQLPELLIVGVRWEGVEREGESPNNWRYLGRVSDGVLVHLYRRARALVFPSLYEGFGLPLVEAMALDCPTICSPIASMKEIGAQGASHFAEQTPQSFLDAMTLLANNDERRRELIEAGRRRVAPITWKRCASETLAACESVR